jgi:hypothetical protein
MTCLLLVSNCLRVVPVPKPPNERRSILGTCSTSIANPPKFQLRMGFHVRSDRQRLIFEYKYRSVPGSARPAANLMT